MVLEINNFVDLPEGPVVDMSTDKVSFLEYLARDFTLNHFDLVVVKFSVLVRLHLVSVVWKI